MGGRGLPHSNQLSVVGVFNRFFHVVFSLFRLTTPVRSSKNWCYLIFLLTLCAWILCLSKNHRNTETLPKKGLRGHTASKIFLGKDSGVTAFVSKRREKSVNSFIGPFSKPAPIED